MAVKNPAVLKLIELEDSCGEQMRFVMALPSRVVHVLTSLEELTTVNGTAFEKIMALMLGPAQTICGKRLELNRGGLEKRGGMVDSFDDNQLCRRCWLAFGRDEGHRIFAANQERPEGETDVAENAVDQGGQCDAEPAGSVERDRSVFRRLGRDQGRGLHRSVR